MNMINAAPALQETDELRADIYALLASLLRKSPDQSLTDWLSDIEPDQDEDTPMTRAWSALALNAQHAQSTQLEDEYHHLFIGVGRGELMPFGCWYLTGSLMEKPLVHLREDLSVLGYERQDQVKEPEDHIAALCEVMSMLITSGRGYEIQHQFWSKHIESWSSRFFNDLQKAKNSVFYSAVGLLGEAFMQQEGNWFLQLSPAALESGKQ
ncbi:TorD/DmsD family molecular chaperone [Neptuniibacter caesariensis]|uniref:TorA specific chaperone, putative n=1 Tax=Neptuniibacter caesariensis TaxID=207954 RepID=A0A7U8C942_NEPCE|nr:molecular chaperone TorD family protein [Neptuniibacter caesariensis]EAR62074.1 TorA specific chaperone, putative [Oceanospirillum sp. MED92] [Neptuniibacter caesariensis]